ncbi:MAG: hypothetical protein P8L31_07810 [Pseudomonadales bacterium]|nr:hypothetical protein [Pseudomonadales bacterium]
MSPLTDEMGIIVVGGGFGELNTGAGFREPGFDRDRIIEKGGNFGGTWYWNRFPGARAIASPISTFRCAKS